MPAELVLTPPFLDALMDGTAEVTSVGGGKMLVHYDAIRILVQENGVLSIDFVYKNLAVAGIEEAVVGVGSVLTLTDLQGSISARIY